MCEWGYLRAGTAFADVAIGEQPAKVAAQRRRHTARRCRRRQTTRRTQRRCCCCCCCCWCCTTLSTTTTSSGGGGIGVHCVPQRGGRLLLVPLIEQIGGFLCAVARAPILRYAHNFASCEKMKREKKNQ